MPLRAVARVNLAAIERNCRLLDAVCGDAALCVVVKGEGYGHGAVMSAVAAQAAGVEWLAVATANEAMDLRMAGIEARLLVLGPLSRQELDIALAADADLVVWTEAFASSVGDMMTRDPVTIDSDATVEEAARVIAERKHNRLPVVEHGRLVGVVTRVDVLDALTA